MLCLASHNIDPSWDELDLDDHKEDSFEADTRCDSDICG